MSLKNGLRSDLIFESKKLKVSNEEEIFTKDINNKNEMFSVIKFPKTFEDNNLVDVLGNKIKMFLEQENIQKNSHIFVVGIGNDSHTADSVGPKVLKHIKVNTYLEELGINIEGVKVSSLEPGVLGETGIDTRRIVESVVEEIKPDVVIVIDSVVAESAENLNNTIEITNRGIIPGSGIKVNLEDISKKSLGIPVIAIGVATAVEVSINGDAFLLSTSDVELFVKKISRVIGDALNNIFYS